MKLTATSNGAIATRVRELRAKAGTPLAATREVGEWIAREARRRAPRGRSGPAGLARSLQHIEPADDTTVLVSDKPYAAVQNFGGGIAAPAGPNPRRTWTVVGAKMLAIPISDFARTLVAFLGARVSLRNGPVPMFVWTSRSGAMFLARVPDARARRSKGRNIVTRAVGKTTSFVKLELLFRLTRRVQIPPQNYAPRADEPGVRAAITRIVTKHLDRG